MLLNKEATLGRAGGRAGQAGGQEQRFAGGAESVDRGLGCSSVVLFPWDALKNFFEGFSCHIRHM